jgi:hypothetical protein
MDTRRDMKSDWKQRFEQAARAFHELKGLTKKVPASEWTPEYGELAELIHTLGREVFYVNPDDYAVQPGDGEAIGFGNQNEEKQAD